MIWDFLVSFAHTMIGLAVALVAFWAMLFLFKEWNGGE